MQPKNIYFREKENLFLDMFLFLKYPNIWGQMKDMILFFKNKTHF